MGSFLAGEIKIFSLMLSGFWILCGVIIPLVCWSIVKDYFKNFTAWVLIKLNTTYQFQNDFIMDGKRCQVLEIRFGETIIMDIETGDTIRMRNK